VEIKKARSNRAFELFDFRLFVDYVFPNRRIVLFGFQLFRMETLVLGYRVVMPAASAGDEFNFFTHCSFLLRLNALSAGAKVCYDFLDTMLVDDSQALVRNAQTYETLLGFEPKSLALQIGQKAPTSFIVCVRNVVA
jgi:hypothetical protein